MEGKRRAEDERPGEGLSGEEMKGKVRVMGNCQFAYLKGMAFGYMWNKYHGYARME